MTDFFALLHQPRQPWLDPDALKEKFYQLTRVMHPDVRAKETSVKFEDINEAYRVLSDPKLRIQHLLALEGSDLSSAADRAAPADLQELFLVIGALSQKAQRVLAQIGSGAGALTLSLLQSDLMQLRSQTESLLEQLSCSHEACLMKLQDLNGPWNQDRSATVARLRELHDRIAYLSRWIAQLKEMELQLILRD
jgi:curved DNA-binding protein CbpA